MKKNAIILVGVLLISFVLMASTGANYTQTIEKDPCDGQSEIHTIPLLYKFTQPPKPAGDGTLTISIRGDYGGSGEYVIIVVEGTTLGTWGGNSSTDCLCALQTTTFPISKEQISQWRADGVIEVTLTQSDIVDCFCNRSESYPCGIINIVTLDYPGANNSLPMQQFMKILGFGKKD